MASYSSIQRTSLRMNLMRHSQLKDKLKYREDITIGLVKVREVIHGPHWNPGNLSCWNISTLTSICIAPMLIRKANFPHDVKVTIVIVILVSLPHSVAEVWFGAVWDLFGRTGNRTAGLVQDKCWTPVKTSSELGWAELQKSARYRTFRKVSTAQFTVVFCHFSDIFCTYQSKIWAK